MSDGKWGDLGPRVLSAIVMVAIGALAVWQGGVVFLGLIVLVVGGMVWELARMLAPDRPQLPVALGALASVCLLAALTTGGGLVMAVLFLPALTGLILMKKDQMIFAAYASGLMLAAIGLVMLRSMGEMGNFNVGLVAVLWLIAIVIASDVAGYFAGRIIGGPKFWPKVSPKKTWSGTVAGWILAALVGLAFALYADLPVVLAMCVSAVLSLAGQMGDIAESAIKRHAGIKDSSNLIPGHGGLLDRFDALMGAALVLVILLLPVS